MAITTRFAGTACPVTVSGQNVTFAGWDVDWEWHSDIVLDTWVVYNVTRSASLVIHAKSGAEGTGYTYTLTGDASAWVTGDLCFVSNSATIATHATIAAEIAASGALDTLIPGYASSTYKTSFSEAVAMGVKPQHMYCHLSRQRTAFATGVGMTGDQSANTTQVVWRNFTLAYAGANGISYSDTGAGKTGGGIKVRRFVVEGYGAGVGIYIIGSGANVVRAEFGIIKHCQYLTYCGAAGLFYHLTGRGYSQFGFDNTSKASTFTNCVSLEAGADFSNKTNGTYTTCASGDTTGTAGLTGKTLAGAKFWGNSDVANGFRSFEGRITTASTLYNTGTAIGGLTTDIDGTAIAAGTCPIGCHSGTVNAYGVAWHANSEIDPLASPVQMFSGMSAPAMDVPALSSVLAPDTLRGVEGTGVGNKAKISSVRG